MRPQRIENPMLYPADAGVNDTPLSPAHPEPFVSPDEAARFLSLKRRYVLELARRGIGGAYALGTGTKRKIWVFRLSELATAVVQKQNAPTPIHKTRKLCDPAFGSPR